MADAYLIDTSSFLKVYEEYPATNRGHILEDLDTLIQASRLKTVRVVSDEVNRHNGQLGRWLLERREQLILQDNDQLLLAILGVVRRFPDLFDPTRNLLQADPFLIAAAQINNMIMVTDELPRHLRRRKSQNERHIPDVCSELGIQCLNLSQMLTIEGII